MTRYILPALSEAIGAVVDGTETKSMIEQAVEDIGAALPPELLALVDERQIAEYRMDAIERQREAGVRLGAPTITRTGHEVGAIYAKSGGGAYLVLGETDTGAVEVEQVVKGSGGGHFVAGDRWTHRTALDHTDRKIGHALPVSRSALPKDHLEDLKARLADCDALLSEVSILTQDRADVAREKLAVALRNLAEAAVAEVGQVWQANLPKRERVEIRRIWDRPDPVTRKLELTARCHPLHGGGPLVIPVALLETEYTLLGAGGGE